MTRQDRVLLNALLRMDFESFLRRTFMTLNPGAPYLPNWHIRAIAYQLDRIRRGEIKRLIINMPPRHLKSIAVSVAWPAFLLGHEPWHRIFAISYGSELSSKHASDFRSIVESNWYRGAFPGMRIARSLEDEVSTTLRGFRKSTSVLGTLTGMGGDIFIIDDPQKPIDAQSDLQRNRLNQWFSNTLVSRLDNKETGAIVVVMQRVHLNDLAGYLMDSSNDWTVLSLPAIAETNEQITIGDGELYDRQAGEALHPMHESIESLSKQRHILGPDVFAAQYQQCPVPAGGSMIRREWLRYYDELPTRKYHMKVIQSWDTAAKNGAQNDWSVCTTWLVVEDDFYLMDVTRGRFEYPQLRSLAFELVKRFKPDLILIEDASTGVALAQDLREIHGHTIQPIPVNRDKIGRLYVQQAKFAAGRVLFPKGAAFLQVLEAELLAFPQGKNDDQVDSISQALAYEKPKYDSSLRWVG